MVEKYLELMAYQKFHWSFEKKLWNIEYHRIMEAEQNEDIIIILMLNN